MEDTQRLTFISDISTINFDNLWNNCFNGKANLEHMNAYVPYPLTHRWQLNNFLTNQHNYTCWLIKRKEEQDFIGFIIHGNFIPGLPNNIGFNIGLNYTRNGFASEALNSLVKYVRDIGLKETFGHCFEANIASISTMEKLGFVNQGRTGNKYNGNFELKFRIQL